MTLVKTFLIIAKTPKGSVWTYSETGSFGCAEYEDKGVAETICARLNRLDLEWSYRVVQRKTKAA